MNVTLCVVCCKFESSNPSRTIVAGLFVVSTKSSNLSSPTVVSLLVKDTRGNRVNYSLTEVEESNKYYRSRVVGVTSEVGFTTDRDLLVFPGLKKYDVCYSSVIPEVTWCEPLYNNMSKKEGERGLSSIENSVDAQYEDVRNKLITAKSD